ncbi:hypothetical protein PR202_ga25669 [Eleusine coracana subsp. coracana]|uniref:Uncharacterized protein n=1 Tax=Eleusine coracana subsp. coracana TaxID=191504 RepID=A0AAV5DBN0_ELECO|nr:hypothetical protein PR202_ga25669 [Eleusine coracana subsp. coracana]
MRAEVPPAKRGLVYPMEVFGRPAPLPTDEGQLPPAPPGDGQPPRRRSRSPSPVPHPSDSGDRSTPRGSVDSRLGLQPSKVRHVASSDTGSSREAIMAEDTV